MTSNHPKGLPVLFFTEMWERFSYYGMRALLVLYLVNHLDFERGDALQVYATYTALVYFTPILGGYLADRFLGNHQAILIGAIIMAAGHFAMAFESLLYVALGLLIIGNGFFKPNISTQVGDLYPPNDARRDSGYTLFYMGINLGAFFSPLVCGTLGEIYGWHYGFSAAGIGMMLGLVIYIYGLKHLTPYGQEKSITLQGQLWRTVGLWSLGCISLVYLLVSLWQSEWLKHIISSHNQILKPALLIIISVLLLYFSLRFSQKTKSLSKIEKDRLWVILILGLFVIFFWMGFEQAGGTLTLFADQQTDRTLFGWEMPASYFQSLNPLLILALAPVFAVMWIRLDQSRFALSIPAKMAVGMIILGLGFVVMVLADQQAKTATLVSPAWLAMVYLLFTIGELFLSPIGLSMVSKMAAPSMLGMMMGIWFSFMAIASYLAGTLESLIQSLSIPLFVFLVASSIGSGLLLLFISPWLSRKMHTSAA